MREVDPLDIVETIREGLLVLEPDLTIDFANRAFCDKFSVAPEDTVGRKLYEIGNGEWDISKLRSALETIIPGGKSIEGFEVEQFFPSIGGRVMCLNARNVYRPGNEIQLILLAIEDVTERVRLEREHAAAHERIVLVTLKRVPGELRLTVADDGQGLDPRRSDSRLGGRLVEGFARQLGGQVEREGAATREPSCV